MPTKSELKLINASYDQQHGVNEKDVEIVNNIIPIIECSRDIEGPQVGDIIEFTNKYGDYFTNAHVDEIRDDKIYICEKPYVPFVSAYRNKISTSTSGGAWSWIPRNLKYIGSKNKHFYIWGHSGACGNGALIFNAEVNVWEYSECEQEYSTKDYDKFNLYVSKDEDTNEVKYSLIQGSKTVKIFNNEADYKKWLKTFNGVELDSYYYKCYKTVWTYKQHVESISIESYKAIEGADIGRELINAQYCECKRVTVGKTVTTYFPPSF